MWHAPIGGTASQRRRSARQVTASISETALASGPIPHRVISDTSKYLKCSLWLDERGSRVHWLVWLNCATPWTLVWFSVAEHPATASRLTVDMRRYCNQAAGVGQRVLLCCYHCYPLSGREDRYDCPRRVVFPRHMILGLRARAHEQESRCGKRLSASNILPKPAAPSHTK